MKHHIICSTLLMFLILIACDRKGARSVSGNPQGNSTPGIEKSPTSGGTDSVAPSEEDLEALPQSEWPKPLLNKVNDKLFGNILCEKAPKAIAQGEKANLDTILKFACKANAPTKLLGQVFSSAYDGSKEPTVKTIFYDVSKHYVTRFVYSFAIRSKLKSPAVFAGLPIYEELGKGLIAGDSIVYTKKTGDRSFPGKGTVREINLEYDLPYAEGAGLYDKRQTQMNTYLLDEATQDINITVEHLLNPETNKIYHTTNSLIIGVKGGQNETFLLYLVELNMINRFDPGRIKRTLSEFGKKVAETVYRISASPE